MEASWATLMSQSPALPNTLYHYKCMTIFVCGTHSFVHTHAKVHILCTQGVRVTGIRSSSKDQSAHWDAFEVDPIHPLIKSSFATHHTVAQDWWMELSFHLTGLIGTSSQLTNYELLVTVVIKSTWPDGCRRQNGIKLECEWWCIGQILLVSDLNNRQESYDNECVLIGQILLVSNLQTRKLWQWMRYTGVAEFSVA